MIIPTGIGCTIGGHAGDATPAARLLASVCDNLIVHPNVVNASDINEMTENMWYVEGSILDRFLKGEIALSKLGQNKILLVVNKPIRGDTINAVAAVQHTLGIDIEIKELDISLLMNGSFNNDGTAGGSYSGVEELVEQIKQYDYDALAIHTEVELSRDIALNYFKNGGVNPWGGIEAIVSKLIATAINKPVAHAPMEREETIFDKELIFYYKNISSQPRTCAELLSTTYLPCVLKGLNTAPRIDPYGRQLNYPMDVLISPNNCYGMPHKICEERNIPIIAVRENNCCLNKPIPTNHIFVENYLEAAGILACMRSSINPKSVLYNVKSI